MPVPEIQFRKYAEPAPSRSTIAGRCAGAPTTASPRRWCCACRSASSNAAIPGTARPTRCSSSTIRLAGGGAVQCRGRGRPAALGAARQRSDDLLRASRDARRRLGAAALSGRRLCPPVRPRAERPREGDSSRIVTWGAMVPRCEAAAEGSGIDVDVIDLRTLMPWDRETVLASVAQDPPLPDRPRGPAHGRLRRRDRGGGRRRGLPRSRRAGRARDHARHSEPAQPELLEAVVPTVDKIAQAMREIAEI